MSKKIKDKELYTTGNINAVSINHYNLCLKKDERIASEQLQELQYDKLERDEQELLIGVMVEGVVTGKADSDGNIIRLEAEVDMLDLINFLGLTNGGTTYRKIKDLIENLMNKKVRKIVKRKTERGVRHQLSVGVVISDFNFDKRDDNKLYQITNIEDFKRITIKIYFSKTFSEVLLHDDRIAFFLRNKHLIKEIQKQPTYVRDVINYMAPVMGDIGLNLNEVLKDIYNNAETAKKTKQRLIKAYKEKEEVRNLFLSCGLKIDADNQKIVKRVKGLKDGKGRKVDPAFYCLDSVY